MRAAFQAIVPTGAPYSADYRMFAKDGRIVWIHDEAVLVRDEEGAPLYWQGVMSETTERTAELERALKAEREEAAELRAIDELKTTFLQAVSHDLRTPLAAILGLAVTLESQEDLGSDEARDLASRISMNARKLDRIVSDLLDLDRISRGILEPNLRPTDFVELVRRVVTESDLLAEHPIELELEPVTIEVDGAKIERIVENLLSNAARHTPSGSKIWIRVGPEGGGALLVVEDDGPGVPPEHREGIFQPFGQGAGAPEHSPGVGIGLAVVSRFAELHGGRAWVEEREGGGASFKVFLPGKHSRGAGA
jgi:signal transduction histidine kinase